MRECWINVWEFSQGDTLDGRGHFWTRADADKAACIVADLWGGRLLYRLHITLKPTA